MQNRMSYSAIEGTLYLKQAYQKNMVIALTVGVMLHLAALGTYIGLTYGPPVPIEGGVIIDGGLRELPPPPPFDKTRGPIDQYGDPDAAIPKIGIPEAVKDWEKIESVVMATRDQVAATLTPGDPGEHGAGGGQAPGITVDGPGIPPPVDSFIVYDSDPEPIYLVTPEYPEMARRAGFEGSLVLRVLIDQDGNVRDARIMRPSGTNVGFEQAAIDAALQGKFTPALQNDHPVMCWYSYTISFSLH